MVPKSSLKYTHFPRGKSNKYYTLKTEFNFGVWQRVGIDGKGSKVHIYAQIEISVEAQRKHISLLWVLLKGIIGKLGNLLTI